MDQERLRLLKENIKAFLLSKKSREVFVFIFFLLISAGFWLLQTLHEEYEMELHVPLRLENVPQGIVVTSELPEELTVVVKDRGTTLLNYYTGSDGRLLTVDFAAHDRGTGSDHVMLSHSGVQKSLAALLEPSTRIVSFRPDTLDYYYTRGVQKRVPVVFRGHVETDPLFYLSRMTLSPDTVTVWANERMLDSLESVSTIVVNIGGLSEKVVRQVPVAVSRGMKVIPSEVTLTAEVDVYTENQVHVPIIGTNFPAGYSLRTFPSTATISFRVGAKDYKKVTAENFVLTATYEELLALPDSSLVLHLRSIPEGVSQVRIEPKSVQFLIEQTGSE